MMRQVSKALTKLRNMRDKAEAEEASHIFAWLLKAFVVSLKQDENGLFEATLRSRI